MQHFVTPKSPSVLPFLEDTNLPPMTSPVYDESPAALETKELSTFELLDVTYVFSRPVSQVPLGKPLATGALKKGKDNITLSNV